MKFLQKKSTRAAAFVIACIMVWITAFGALRTFIKYDVFSSGENKYYNYTEDINRLYTELWAAANIYMRNLGSDGKFSGSEYLEKNTKEVMHTLGLMDENDIITIPNADNFEYILEYNGNKITNTDKSINDFPEKYSFRQKNDEYTAPEGLYWYSYYDVNWYTTNYGMSYYNLSWLLPEQAVAVFDFDTSGLPYYYDPNGAKIYYKTDGTTPLPYNLSVIQNSEYIDIQDSEDEIYDEAREEEKGVGIIEEATSVSAYTDENYTLIYNSATDELIRVNESNFKYIEGNDTPITIYIKPTDIIISEMIDSEAEENLRNEKIVHSLINLIPFAVTAIVLSIYILIAGGYSYEEKRFVLQIPNNIPAELFLAFIIGMGFVVSGLLVGFESLYEFFTSYYKAGVMPLVYGFSFTFVFAASLAALNAIVIQMKCRLLWKKSICGRICRRISALIKKLLKKMNERRIEKEILQNDAMTRRFLKRTFAAAGAETLLIMICMDWQTSLALPLFLTILLFSLYIRLNLKDFSDINRLSEHISAINSGDYSIVKIPENSATYAMSVKLNDISGGLQNAVEKRVQSERMKIDLVTNVSHDLKTPLTSIISYINLLSSEELTPEAKDYVKILDSKAARLKAIVSDLFDLAKATSRTDIQAEQIDAVILTNQVLGDMADKIEKYGKNIRTDIQINEAPVMAEGKKLYRVLQNLIDNALKYSLDGTRIYITVREENHEAVISVKNISENEMKFTAEEITERFTRGDESRTTEGSGLGLSIAKSFTEACGGKFEIILDGDMFTAEIRLALCL